MTNRFSLLSAVLVASTFTSLMGADGGCGSGPPILDNNGFDLWCGNRLCYWEVEAGTVSKAPTWHRKDYAASFGGTIVAISQLSEINSGNTPCLQFRAVADVDLSVTMVLEIDYNDDGVVDVTERIPTSNWARVEFQFATPQTFDGARFRLRKEGVGRAVLAEMQVNRGSKCSGSRPQLVELELGVRCSSDLECSSGLCAWTVNSEQRCSLCEDDDTCTGTQVCGIFDPGVPAEGLSRGCTDLNSGALGTSCLVDEHCQSSKCDDGICGTCVPDQALECASNQVCSQTIFVVDDDFDRGPNMCGESSSSIASGGVCASDFSCASEQCDGTPILRCSQDNRECVNDDDCPGDDVCATVAIVDGTCQ